MRAARAGDSLAIFCGLLLNARLGLAQPRADNDTFELIARSDTYASLFRRALVPGRAGSLVETETAAPIYEYVSVRALRLDIGPLTDALSVEVSAWARGWPTAAKPENQLDGDVQTAFATLSHGPGFIRLGRQQMAGGAARFVRFDGLMLGGALGAGFEAGAYTGLTVLPRWDARPGYHHLGGEADTLLRDSDALAEPERSGHWLAGARFGYASSTLSASASFHEQREDGGLAHRNLGIDATGRVGWASLHASTILDTEALGLADARVWANLLPLEAVSLTVEYLHTEPALWLSRQSVLSVFAADRFDEAGGIATARLSSAITLEGAGFLTVYDDGRPGMRSEGSMRLAPDLRTVLRLSYVRLLAPKNGYHSLRASLSRRLLARTTGTLEAYSYLYDHAIASYRTSSVYSATLSRQIVPAWALLIGGSLARTPYAGLDAQALARASYSFEHSSPGGR
jgi:hypothetical protein